MKPALYRYRFVLVFVLGAALFTAGFFVERQRRQAVSARAPERVRGSLGPTPGPNADGYVAAKRAYLAAAAQRSPSARAAALVSLSRFEAAGELPSEPKLLFVRFPGAEAEVLLVQTTPDQAMTTRASAVASALRSEAAALRALAGQSKGSPGADRLREAEAKQSQAASIVPGCACVYGYLSVALPLSRLAALAQDPRVRLVDVSRPPQPDLRGWELRPILPKDPGAAAA